MTISYMHVMQTFLGIKPEIYFSLTVKKKNDIFLGCFNNGSCVRVPFLACCSTLVEVLQHANAPSKEFYKTVYGFIISHN